MTNLINTKTSTTATTESKVFVTTYELYNNGEQFKNENTGFWIDTYNLEIETLEDHFKELCNVEDVELMFTDFEGFPKALYSETMTQTDFDNITTIEGFTDYDLIAFNYLVDFGGYDIKTALEKYEEVDVYEGDINTYAYEFAEEMGLKGFALQYFDCASWVIDAKCGGDIVELSRNSYVLNANSL